MSSVKAIALLCLLGLSYARVPNLNIFKSYNHEHASCPQDYFMKFIPSGYPVEMHQVISKDGFKLTLFRLQAKGTTMQKGLHPVLLQHGIDDSALSWVMNGEEKSMGFVLANQGFDVWLGNNRGNKFSREHTTLHQDERAFWDFSFQDMGEIDIPAFISKIREESGSEKITYVGHSQGTSQMFAALSDPVSRDLVAPYIDTFHAFAPVVYLSTTQLMGFQLAKIFYWALNPASYLFHITHFELGKCNFDGSLISKYEKKCSSSKCNFFKNTDPYPEMVNYEAYGYEDNTHPAGFSMKCIIHFAQLIKEKKTHLDFHKFDYGSKEKNMEKYGQPTAPMYQLDSIKNRVVLYLGDADRLADFTDTSAIAAKLTSAEVVVKDMQKWGHMSFVMPKDGDKFYAEVAQDIKQRLAASRL